MKLLVQNGLLRFEINDIPRIFPEDWRKENSVKLEFLFKVLQEEPDDEF